MTAEEFNEKYKDYLEEGHYGLDIHNEEVINYLDKEFKKLIKIPKFSYSQIKIKYGVSRVYVEPWDKIDSAKLEKDIDNILKSKLNV